MVGSCMMINATHWSLVQRDNKVSTTVKTGMLTVTPEGWHKLALSFDEDELTAHVDGVSVASGVRITSAWSGVVGIDSYRIRQHRIFSTPRCLKSANHSVDENLQECQH
eukprot:SAG31_NODE_605_length_13628_cov_24.848030_14_plen_109_part_00